jgi:hypothetical protein
LAIGAGAVGPILLALALAIFLIAMTAGVWFSWRHETAAYRRRLSRPPRHLTAAKTTGSLE